MSYVPDNSYTQDYKEILFCTQTYAFCIDSSARLPAKSEDGKVELVTPKYRFALTIPMKIIQS